MVIFCKTYSYGHKAAFFMAITMTGLVAVTAMTQTVDLFDEAVGLVRSRS